MDSYYSATTKPLFRASQIIWYIASVIEVLLITRFVLKLLAANPGAGFSKLIYSLSDPLIVPFTTVFPSSTVASNVFEWTTLLAIFTYWLVALALVRLLSMSRSVSRTEAAHELGRHDTSTLEDRI